TSTLGGVRRLGVTRRRKVPRARAGSRTWRLRLTQALLPGELARTIGGTGLLRWNAGTADLARPLLLRELAGTISWAGVLLRRNAGTADLPEPLLLWKFTGLTWQLHARQFTGSTGLGRWLTIVAVRTAWLIRRPVSRGRRAGMIGRYGPKPGWLFAGTEFSGLLTGPIPGRLLTGTVSRLTRRHAGPGSGAWLRFDTGPRSRLTTHTLLVEPRFSSPVRRLRSMPRLTRTRCGDVPLVLPGSHPTLPRRDGRRALCRSVATIVVVVPMSGIIVAHHASCTRRNPRIPPVR
ncbi:hypothetical protein ACFU44_23550, partial [Nocardia rhizosphaerihabitans]|uniref:hypothetical protein n=1 Tax=Nocardia rhizosphaerihabitans TaxID=1691570 RepID=UPI003673163A